MIVNKNKIRFGITDILMAAVSIAFLIGIRTWFAVCPVMSEMIMSCHWAGESLKALSVVMAVTAVVHIFIYDEKIKLGMDIPFLCICILSAFIPGGIINLCQSAEMACRSLTRPWSIIICAVMIIIIAVDMIFYGSRISHAKHQRKDAA